MQLSKNEHTVSRGLRSCRSALGNENRNSSSCLSHLAAVSPARHLSATCPGVPAVPAATSGSHLGLSPGSDTDVS